MKYQKRPVTIEAWKWADENEEPLPDWLISKIDDGTVLFDGFDARVSTLEGVMNVKIGDFIIKGVRGEIYSCKPDIFEETYIKVNDTDRVSPDEIGNDIHEFLHGGDK